MATSRFRAWTLAGAGALGALAACNQMLGIDSASVDPRLTAAGAGSAGHAPASPSGAGGTDATGVSTGGTSGGQQTASGGSSGQKAHSGGSSADDGEAGATHGTPGTGGSSATGGSTVTGGEHGEHDDGASGEAGAGGAPASGPVDLCNEYCDILDDACKSDAEQYRDRDQCMTICHLLPQGTVGGADDDSVACRLKYAQKTRYTNGAETAGYCREAGPGGDGRCGTVCEGYCTLMAQVCTQQTAGMYHFASNDDCLATCNALPQATVPYSDTNPLVSDGNHALCRLFHVASAAMADADEHCEHAMGVTLCEATGQ